MHIFDTFDQLIQTYFNAADTSHGFDPWVIAAINHTPDELYTQQQAEGGDRLGFQPTLFTLANPRTRQTHSVVVKNIRTPAVTQLKAQLRQRFTDQFDKRIGLFAADKYQGDAVYETWEDFAHEWIEQPGSYRLPYNLPLLLDHVPDLEYWAWGQKGFNPVGSQRLILTLFQPRTGKFADIFITNVDDAEAGRIALLLSSHLKLHIDRILYA